MIQIEEITTSGGEIQVRPACRCGEQAIALYPCEDDPIVFCTHCGALTTRGRLLRDAPLPSGGGTFRWVGVIDQAECPLLAVAIPVRVRAHAEHGGHIVVSAEHPGTITKISVDKCFLRLEGRSQAAVLHRHQEVELDSGQPPLTESMLGLVEDVVWPHGPQGHAYYKIHLVPLRLGQKTALEEFFQDLYVERSRKIQSSNGRKPSGKEDPTPWPAPAVPAETKPATPGEAGGDTKGLQGRPRPGAGDEDAVRMLCVASETHDPHISNHLNRISAYSAAVARQLGLEPARIALLATAGKLHDVGKLGVPDEILRKTGALTADERAVMQEHTRFGWRILQAGSSELMRLGALIALRHHERHDGAGYPDGLAGDAIPIEARIVSVADVFDALTTQRVYKPAWSLEKAVEFLQEQAGRAFDPAAVEAFLRAQQEIEQTQLRFMDDFRDVWTERRRFPRIPTPPVPLTVEIAMPEMTFRPQGLAGEIQNISSGGARLLLRDVSLGLFTMLISSRRYARLGSLEGAWATLSHTPCSVSWVDYYSVPDPTQCLIGLNFQKAPPELDRLIEALPAGY